MVKEKNQGDRCEGKSGTDRSYLVNRLKESISWFSRW